MSFTVTTTTIESCFCPIKFNNIVINVPLQLLNKKCFDSKNFLKLAVGWVTKYNYLYTYERSRAN